MYNNEGRDGGYGDQAFSPGFRTNALRSTFLVHGRSCRRRRCERSKRVANTGRRAAQSAWRAGAYLSLLHARLIKGRKWAAWLRSQREIVTEDTARRYILLYERTGGRASELDGMTLTEAYAAFGITRFTEIASSNETEPDHRYRLAQTPPVLNGTNGRVRDPLVSLVVHQPPMPMNRPTPSLFSTRRRSSKRRLRSANAGSQNGSRRSRSDGNNHTQPESRNVAVPSCTAIAST